MNTIELIKSTMKQEGLDVWTLASRLDMKNNTLSAVMLGETPVTGTLTVKIKSYLLSVGLCPDCASKLVMAGGCKHCHCGFSAC